MRIGALLAAWGRPRPADIGRALSGSSPQALKAYYLSSIDVFRDLPRSEVERLAETTRMITCPRGKVVYRAGESNEARFLLKTGRVQTVAPASTSAACPARPGCLRGMSVPGGGQTT